MRRILIIPVIVSLLYLSTFSAYGQSGNDISKAIVTGLKDFTSTHNTEKAYLHLDKPYYATGDTIYFKAYVTSGERHELSNLSGVLHIDLINPANKIEQGIKLQIVNGLSWGDFVLPDTLAPGNYRIRAYTRWMLNDGNLFEQSIPVGSVHTQKVPENSTAKAIISKPDLQFFPESGQLIAGLPAKVAFKAIGTNGLGMGVKGSVTDNSGKMICQLESSHLGMGSYSFIPEAGKSYKANVMFADGSKSSLDLPAPVNKGIALSVNNDSLPKAGVKILSNAAYYAENKGKDYTLLIYSGGSATTVPIKLDSSVISLDILKRRLHTGIATITLFSNTNEPLCERLIFVQNYDKLNLSLSADKGNYATREKVSIKLNAKTRADSASLGHFSVSVIDESKVEVNEDKENTILSSLLLTSDLKGTVEQPNYYFTNITDEKLKELDLVMLTHGYRRFEWEQVLNNKAQSLAYQPEKSLEITGQAKNLLGASLAKANVSLLPTQSKQVFTTKADDKGYFAFKDMTFWDSTTFVLQATNAKGKVYTKLAYNSDKPVPVAPALQSTDKNSNAIISPAYLANSERQQEELNKVGFGKGRILKEVKIKGFKPDDQYETQSLLGAGHADQVVHAEQMNKVGGPLSLKLAGKFHGPLGFKITQGYFPGLVVVDGLEEDPKNFTLNDINGDDVETVELLQYSKTAMYGMQGGGGVLIITTKKGHGTSPKDIASVGILPITVQGYQKVREFYSPKYESGITYNHPDLRSTIYWKPELATDKGGNASFDFFNADGIGTYQVVIEGIDEKGNIGRQIYRYKVD
jgi:hypothetical protein